MSRKSFSRASSFSPQLRIAGALLRIGLASAVEIFRRKVRLAFIA
jgi:hypothetical protein